MVAIVSSNNLGLSNNALGSNGVLGSGVTGRNGELVTVNIATGNLIVQDQDELLASHGPDLAILRTYNSLGRFDDDNGDNWSDGFYRQQISLANGLPLNSANSALLRTERDGAQSLFTYDSTRRLYVSSDGAGAYNTIRYQVDGQGNATFEYQDGTSRNRSLYDANGHLQAVIDASGNRLDYAYENGLLSQISDGQGNLTHLDYNGNQLSQIRTETLQDGVPTHRSRVHYEYQGNVLSRVSVDLTPGQSDPALKRFYTTDYSYSGNQLIRISQSDGTSLSFAYDGQNRVQTITDALQQVTLYTYADGATTITDPLQLTSTYEYDSKGQLSAITVPNHAGRSQITRYDYNERGDLLTLTQQGDPTSSTDPNARFDSITRFTYDPLTGNQLTQSDNSGNLTKRRYNADNQLVSETSYLVPDPDGSGPRAAASPSRTRYVYDNHDRLRFVVSGESRVTEYRYNGFGERSSSIVQLLNNGTLLPTGDVLSESALASWISAQDHSQTQRTDYSYDGRGLLAGSTVYQRIGSDGVGLSDGASTTHYVYDPSGLLLQTITPDQAVTLYARDGLGRVIARTDAHHTTTTQYDDANNQTTVTLANGLLTVSSYDAAGRLLNVSQQNGANTLLGQTSYLYDADGRLRQTSDPTGQRQWLLYDDAGRRQASVDEQGKLTEYRYDNHNNLIRSIDYATPVVGENLTNLKLHPTSTTLAELYPVASLDDRVLRNVYDLNQRLIKSVDAQGFLTTYRYDGAGQLIGSTAFTTAIAATTLAALDAKEAAGLEILATDLPDPQHVTALDRSTRRLFDLDGLLVAELDGEGYLTQYQYNGAGQTVQTIRRDIAVPANQRAAMTLAQLQTYAESNADGNDIINTTLYNAKGQVVATIDGEQYLTRYGYDANGNRAITTRYAHALTERPAPNSDAEAVQPDPSPQDQTTLASYDAQNRLIQSTNAEGKVTEYRYDAVGNVIASYQNQVSRAEGGVRGVDKQFDVQGRVVAELSGEGSRLLHSGNPSPAEINDLWAKYAVRYTYDAAGRRTSSTDQNQHSTLYYYDVAGRLQYSVNPAGEVTGQEYDLQGELTRSTRYATRIDEATLRELVADTLDRATQTHATPRRPLTVVVDAANDSSETRSYDTRGLLTSQKDALGTATRFTYTAFGQIKTRTTPVGSLSNLGSFSYDRRGLAVSAKSGAGAVVSLTSTVYDAFGRAISVDNNGQSQTREYDRLGRVIEIQTPNADAPFGVAINTTTYDAFDRVLTSSDRLGNKTVYQYDLATRSSTVLFDDGHSQTRLSSSVNNRYGQRISVQDGNGNTTHYEYDGDGRLLSLLDALGSQQNVYDKAGLLHHSIDGRGTVTLYRYDAANRVLSKTIDPRVTEPSLGLPLHPNGLDLTTRYTFDAKGQTISVTDPKGNVSQTVYDNNGRVIKTIVDASPGPLPDPSHLQLSTSYTYDNAGNLTKVVAPNGQATSYKWDVQGRRISQSVALESGVNAITTYRYDSHNNVIAATDPNGNLVRYWYNEENRLILQVDGNGSVTETKYDVNGRVTGRIGYANPLDPASLSDTTDAATLRAQLRPDDRRDNENATWYDGQGRVRFVQNGGDGLQGFDYDANGNVWRQTRYDFGAGTDVGLARLEQNTRYSENRIVTIKVYDARNRQVYENHEGLEGVNSLTQWQYDANDNLYQKIDYAKPVSLRTDQPPSIAQVVNALQNSQNIDAASAPRSDATDRLNQNQILRYDAANRLIARATLVTGSAAPDAPINWRVENLTLDANGNLLARDVFAVASASLSGTVLDASGADALLASQTAPAAHNPASDSHSRYVYDLANRVTASASAIGLDASGQLRWAVSRYSYDKNGNQIGRVDYASALTTSTDLVSGPYSGEAASASLLAGVAKNSTLDHISRNFYDLANRPTFAIDPSGAVTQNVYDGNGNIVQQIAYAKTVPVITTNSLAALQGELAPAGQTLASRVNWVNDGNNRISNTVYDAGNRAVYRIDALGHVQENRYDALGNAVHSTRYATPLPGNLLAAPSTRASVAQALQPSNADRSELRQFDARGREILRVDAEHFVTLTGYDARGLVKSVSRYDQPIAGPLPDPLQDQDAYASLRLRLRDSASNDYSGRTTRYAYDNAGNLIWQTDPDGSTQQWHYDVLNRKTDYTNQKGDQWRYEYNSAGQLTREIGPLVAVDGGSIRYDNASNRATLIPFDTSLVASITRNEYDVFGNLLSRTEAAGTPQIDPQNPYAPITLFAESNLRTTRYEYDALGHQIKTILPQVAIADTAGGINLSTLGNASLLVNPTSSTGYDTFGNAVLNEDVGGVYQSDGNGGGIKIANGNFSYKTYDAAGRVRHEIDAAGLVTEYQRNAFGEVTRLTRYASAPVLTTPAAAPDGVLPIVRLFALLGIPPTAAKLAPLAAQSASTPLDQLAQSVLAAYPSQYPASLTDRNFIIKLYNNGFARTPSESEISSWIAALHAPGQSRASVLASISSVGDGRNSDAVKLNAKVAGLFSIYRSPAKPVTLAAVTSALAQIASNRDRSVTSRYDLLGRETLRSEPLANLHDSGFALLGAADVQVAKNTATRYNAFGDAIQVSVYGLDAAGNLATRSQSHYDYFDHRGNKVTQIDVAQQSNDQDVGYLTSYQYDFAANLTRQIDYARLFNVTELQQSNLSGFLGEPEGDDRSTRYTYDKLNRKASESRDNISYLDASGNRQTGNVVTEFGYDAVGNLQVTRDSLGRSTISNYNALGFVTAVLANAVASDGNGNGNANGNTNGNLRVGTLTTFKRDIYGQVVARTEHALAGVAQPDNSIDRLDDNPQDRTSFGVFDTSGHQLAAIDAEQHLTLFSYDAFGRLTKQIQTVTNNVFGTHEESFTVVQYDALGHVRDLATRDVRHSLDLTQTSGIAHELSNYNAFGELLGKKLQISDAISGAPVGTATVLENNYYDNAGYLFRTNAGDGIDKLNLYDINGNLSGTIRTIRTITGNVADITDESGLASLDPNAAIRSEIRYDYLGHAISQTSSYGATTLRSFDRWGNLLGQFDPRNANWITRYRYNAYNQQTESSVTQDGHVISHSSTGYDQLGREVATTDGNEHTSRKQYDADNHLVLEQHADGGSVTHRYNRFGNQTELRVARDADSTHDIVTTYDYDKLNHLLATHSAAVEVFTSAIGGTPPPLPPGGDVVLRLHTLLFGVAPTREQLDQEAPQALTNDGQIALANSLIAHSPLKDLSDNDFVTRLYDIGLARAPETGGFTFWTGKLAISSVTRGLVARDFSTVAFQGNSDSITFNARVAALRLLLTGPDGSNNSGVSLQSRGFQQLVEQYRYDELGRRIQTINAAGEISSSQYDLAGNVIVTSDAFDQRSQSAYDSFHHLIAQRDANGNETNASYSFAGRILQSTALHGAGANPAQLVSTHYHYDSAGQLTSQDSTLGTHPALLQNITYRYQNSSNRYDGLLHTITDHAVGVQTDYGYDAAGNRTRETTVTGSNETVQDNTIVFDAANRITEIDDHIRFKINYTYDGNGNRRSIETHTHNNDGTLTDQTRYNQYDAQNRATLVNNDRDDVSQLASGAHRIAYDLAGNRINDTYLGTRVTVPLAQNSDQLPPGVNTFFGVERDAETTESYGYDAAGRLVATYRDALLQVDQRAYDAAGRVLRSGVIGVVEDPFAPPEETHYTNRGAVLDQLGINKQYTLDVYDRSHRIREKSYFLSTSPVEGDGAVGDDIYFEDTQGAGYDAAGNLKGYNVVSRAGLTRYSISYRLGNGYQEDVVSATTNGNTDTTQSSYDVNNNRSRLLDTTSRVNGGIRQRDFVFDASGQILKKTDHINLNDPNSKITQTFSLIANGALIGSNEKEAAKDIGNAYESVNASSLSNAPSYYTVRQGGSSTFQAIAQEVWGDAKLWYVIADANPSADLAVGALVKIPVKPNTINNDANTFKPYDPSRLTGPTSPALPAPPADDCGVVGQLVTLAVAVAVAYYTGQAQGFQAIFGDFTAAAAAVAGNVASQAVGNVIGTQSGFSFKSAALAAISAEVSSDLAPAKGVPTTPAGNIARAALGSAITQGIGVVTGLQNSFSFRSVVASGIGTGVGATVGSALGVDPNAAPTFAPADFGKRLLTSLAAGGATAIARGGRVSVVQVAADAFEQTLGSALAAQTTPNQSAAETKRLDNYEKAAQELEAATNRGLLNRANVAADPDYYSPLAAPVPEASGPFGGDDPTGYPRNKAFRFFAGGPAAADVGGYPLVSPQTGAFKLKLSYKDDIAKILAEPDFATVGVPVQDLPRFGIAPGSVPDYSANGVSNVNNPTTQPSFYDRYVAPIFKYIAEADSKIQEYFTSYAPTDKNVYSGNLFLQGAVKSGQSSITIPNFAQLPVLTQIKAGNDFAYLPKGTPITASQVKNVLGQLTNARNNPNLSSAERGYLSQAYANVYTRGNVEGVLNAALTPGYAAYALDASIATGGTAIKGTISRVPEQDTVLQPTNSRLIPVDQRALTINEKISAQKQLRHLPETAPEGKSYMDSLAQAQAVLDAYRAGSFTLISEEAGKNRVTIYTLDVTATYKNSNNPFGLPDIERPTNVFTIDSLKAPKVFPVNPDKGRPK